MVEAAKRAKQVILGTATPIQTDVEELWDLLEILNRGADHVLGRWGGPWRQCRPVLPLLTGKKAVKDEGEGWNLLRNPLPPRHEGAPLFDHIRQDLGLADHSFFTDRPVTDLESFVRTEFRDALEVYERGLSFFQRNNPLVRHMVLRKRATLEDMGLLDRVAVDIWPSATEHLAMFDDQALLTSAEFDGAYQAAEKFTEALRQRVRSAGFMKSVMLQRICSSFASGLATARKLLNKLPAGDEEEANFFADVNAGMTPSDASDEPAEIEAERHHLQAIIEWLERKFTDPKLDAVLHFLNDRKWLDCRGDRASGRLAIDDNPGATRSDVFLQRRVTQGRPPSAQVREGEILLSTSRRYWSAQRAGQSSLHRRTVSPRGQRSGLQWVPAP